MRHRLFFITVFLTTFTISYARALYAPLEQFAHACLKEKQLLSTEQPDQDMQFEQLYACLKSFTVLPLINGPAFLHPSRSCTDVARNEHITFSPFYLVEYMNGNIPNPYTHSFPYAANEPVHISTNYVAVDGETDTVSIYYVNAVLCPLGEERFEYNITAGEQQLVVIAEDDTALEVVIRTETDQTVLHTDTPQGFAQRIWDEAQAATAHVSVKNPSDRPVSFVIAVH